MKTLKVFIFSLFIFTATFFSFSEQAHSNVASGQESVSLVNCTQYVDIINGRLCLVTCDEDGKIIDVLVID